MAEPTTIIGEYTSVQGNLEGDEDLIVLGRVDGAIQLNKTLIVEPTGVVKADVSVQSAVINGVVVGNVEATKSVHIAAEGRMVGDIVAPRVVIAEGAMFRGRIDMGDTEPSESAPEEQAVEEAPKRPSFARAAPAPTHTAGIPVRRNEPKGESIRRPAGVGSRRTDGESSRRPAGVPSRPLSSRKSSKAPAKKPTSKKTDATVAPAAPELTKRRRSNKETSAKDQVPVEALRETSNPARAQAAEPPPPKPRVAPKKRRVSVKKK
jgi:cytoskeletal protein CcmA (bactofilin family)